MTVGKLRDICSTHSRVTASQLGNMLDRQKIGFRIDQVYSQRPQIIDIILLDSLLLANEPISETDNVRLPIWISRASFNKFISKITNYATDILP